MMRRKGGRKLPRRAVVGGGWSSSFGASSFMTCGCCLESSELVGPPRKKARSAPIQESSVESDDSDGSSERTARRSNAPSPSEREVRERRWFEEDRRRWREDSDYFHWLSLQGRVD